MGCMAHRHSMCHASVLMWHMVEPAVEADKTHEHRELYGVGIVLVLVLVLVLTVAWEPALACARDMWCSSTPFMARFPRSMVGCSQPVPMPHRHRMINDTTVRAMASAQEAPFLDVLQHQGLIVTVCDVGLAPLEDEGGIGQLGGVPCMEGLIMTKVIVWTVCVLQGFSWCFCVRMGPQQCPASSVPQHAPTMGSVVAEQQTDGDAYAP